MMRVLFFSTAVLFVVSIAASAQDSTKATTNLSLLFLGDIMQHDSQLAAAFDAETGKYDYHECFEHVKPVFESADMTIGNLELSLGGKPYKGYPAFSAPDGVAGDAYLEWSRCAGDGQPPLPRQREEGTSKNHLRSRYTSCSTHRHVCRFHASGQYLPVASRTEGHSHQPSQLHVWDEWHPGNEAKHRKLHRHHADRVGYHEGEGTTARPDHRILSLGRRIPTLAEQDTEESRRILFQTWCETGDPVHTRM